MTTMLDRREAVKALALLPIAFRWDLSVSQLERAAQVFRDAPRREKPVRPARAATLTGPT